MDTGVLSSLKNERHTSCYTGDSETDPGSQCAGKDRQLQSGDVFALQKGSGFQSSYDPSNYGAQIVCPKDDYFYIFFFEQTKK